MERQEGIDQLLNDLAAVRAERDAALSGEGYRNLKAERDTLKALCIELVGDLVEWNDAFENRVTSELLTRARSILK